MHEVFHPFQPVRFRNPTSCCGLVVLVNETAETVPASDRLAAAVATRAADPPLIARRQKIKASVPSLVVVVPHVLVENTFKVTSTPDQYPVQALLPDGSHPSLGDRVGVRCLDRRLYDLD